MNFESGSSFGGYCIEGLIAGGGMGRVFAARHDVYGSPVALKILHTSLHEDVEWRRRFNLEGVIGQQLKHPNVVAARELVEQEGHVGIVLDLVSGGLTLHRAITREFVDGLERITALRVFLAIVQGVEYAHGKGVIHGDIKPENVLIEGALRTPSEWTPKVTDFGTVGIMAHPVYIDGSPAVVVSPRYASPEHLLGINALTEVSDVYTLGLLLHFLLTGRHASTARDVAEAAIQTAEPVSLVGLIDHSESIIHLVRRATQIEMGARFQSCRELAVATRAVLDALGGSFQTDDLKADLATEVMEDRVAMRAGFYESPSLDLDPDTLGADAAEADTLLLGPSSGLGSPTAIYPPAPDEGPTEVRDGEGESATEMNVDDPFLAGELEALRVLENLADPMPVLEGPDSADEEERGPYDEGESATEMISDDPFLAGELEALRALSAFEEEERQAALAGASPEESEDATVMIHDGALGAEESEDATVMIHDGALGAEESEDATVMFQDDEAGVVGQSDEFLVESAATAGLSQTDTLIPHDVEGLAQKVAGLDAPADEAASDSGAVAGLDTLADPAGDEESAEAASEGVSDESAEATSATGSVSDESAEAASEGVSAPPADDEASSGALENVSDVLSESDDPSTADFFGSDEAAPPEEDALVQPPGQGKELLYMLAFAAVLTVGGVGYLLFLR